MVEAALHRPGVGRLGEAAGDMPLAAEIARIIPALERFGDRHATLVQIAGIAFRTVAVGEDADAGLVRMQAGQQRGARRAAARGVVELRVTQPVRRKTIEVRRLDLAAVTANVRKAHVVVEDEQDVGAVGSFGAIRHVCVLVFGVWRSQWRRVRLMLRRKYFGKYTARRSSSARPSLLKVTRSIASRGDPTFTPSSFALLASARSALMVCCASLMAKPSSSSKTRYIMIDIRSRFSSSRPMSGG